MPIRRQKRKKKTEVKDVMPNLEEPKNQFLQWWQHVRKNLILYAIGVGFIIFCVVVGSAYATYRSAKNRDVMTRFAKAMLEDKISSRAEKLKPLLDISSPLLPQIMYVYGETVFALGRFDEAESVWKKIIDKYPGSEWAPNAMEGLAYIEELRKNYEKAEKMYSEIKEKWPNSFIAKRQYFNIGRILEAKNEFEKAVEAYKKQKDDFPESRVAEKAEQALERLKSDHPELFPEEKTKEEGEKSESQSSNLQEGANEQPSSKSGEQPASSSRGMSQGSQSVSQVSSEGVETKSKPSQPESGTNGQETSPDNTP